MAIVLIALIFVATYLLMSYFRGLFLTATTAALQATDEFASFVSEVADAREIIGTLVTTDLATFGM